MEVAGTGDPEMKKEIVRAPPTRRRACESNQPRRQVRDLVEIDRAVVVGGFFRPAEGDVARRRFRGKESGHPAPVVGVPLPGRGLLE
jgi:hypothetical protein